MAEDWQHGGFGLYVHWPFCEAKCPYCDFNSHVTTRVDHTRWARALVRSIEIQADLTGPRVLNAIFFGGGTPSLMSPATVEAVLEATRRCWIWANDVEITMEANPRSVEAGRFRDYAAAGVNRLSLGIQALDDDALRRLGRLHSAREALDALDIARQCFDRVSFDLIYARQDQSLAEWRSELEAALTLAGDHLSLYQLTVEDGTAFGDRARRGRLRGLPNEDLSADMYEVTQELCEADGLPAYEISNHARPGAESRHNLIYWQSGDWAAVGPGAHGRLTLAGERMAFAETRMPAAWLDDAEDREQIMGMTGLSSQDVIGEHIMMGLRLRSGVDLERLRVLGLDLVKSRTVADLIDDRFVEILQGRLRATERGRLVLNQLIATLLPD